MATPLTDAQLKRLIDEYNKLNKEIETQISGLKGVNSEQERSSLISEKLSNNQRIINELQKAQIETGKDYENLINKHKKIKADILDNEKRYNDELKKQIENRKKLVDWATVLGNQLNLGWKYLQDSDKVIRSTILNLGMSGVKAAAMRTSFEQSAGIVTRLGGTLADIKSIMEGYADETGRARALSAEMIKDITFIGKGTGLGIEQAAKLGAQFELMGFDAKKAMDYAQGIVDTSERMGINTTKVLKNINDNFKKVNTYSFRTGSKGIAEMAMNAEKMKVDMKDALSAADAAKGLEKAIDLAANLQIMGGEFAKTDPFEWMYLARNEPDKLTKKISEMTRGLVTFKKNSDGTFEKFISPADRQRLESVAKSLGISAEEMTQIAQRRADLDKMASQLAGKGLTSREKELVEGAAVFNAKSGKFEVQLAGRMQDISTLTANQAKSFEKEQVTLEERAKQAMTFDEAFKATIETLKSALLPLLKAVNIILEPLGRFADKMSKIAGTWGGAIAAAGLLLLGAAAWKGASILFNKGIENFISRGIGKIFGGGGGTGNGGNTDGNVDGNINNQKWWQNKSGGIRKGAPELIKAQGSKALKTGGGIGAAALGIGAGIGLAATGISKLADSMSKLDATQIAALPKTIWALAGAFFAFTPAIIAVSQAGQYGALGLVALGAAVVGIGFGINLAAKGIGIMSEGLSKLITSGKGAGWTLAQIGVGILSINAAMAAGVVGAVGGFLGGFKTLNKTLSIISANADGMFKVGDAFKNINTAVSIGTDNFKNFAENLQNISNIDFSKFSKNANGVVKIGEAFKQINAVMSGNKEDFIAVQNAIESISKANIKGGGMLADLATLLKSPLKVEFADKNIAMVNDITLEIDGQKFMQKVYRAQTAAIKTQEAKQQGQYK